MDELTKGFHRLGYLAAAVKYGSVRAGADSMRIAPSVVSRQIAILEKEFGFKLIESRGRNGIEPTEAAQVLLDCFKQIQDSSQHAASRLENLKTKNTSNVKIVASGGFLPFLKNCLYDLLNQPKFSPVTLEFMPAVMIIDEILKGSFHFALVVAPVPHPDIEVVSQANQPLKLMVREDHDIAKHNEIVEFSTIAQYPIALSSPYIGVRQLIHRVETYEKISLRPELTTNSLEILHEYVLTGMGISLSPELAFMEHINSGRVKSLSITNSTFLSAEACIIKKRGKHLSQSVIDCLEICKGIDIFRKD